MKADLQNLENIIFDLGGVLLNLDFDASIQAFHELGMDKKVVNRQQAYADKVFYELETGAVSVTEFRSRVRKILDNPDATDQQIDDAWYAMIKDIPAHRVEMVQKLSRNFNVYLFSNTNQIHIQRLHADFKEHHGIDFPSLFKKDYYSFEIKERKPELDSYLKVIELAGIDPAKSLFIDDLEKNITGAEKAGLRTYWLDRDREVVSIFG